MDAPKTVFWPPDHDVFEAHAALRGFHYYSEVLCSRVGDKDEYTFYLIESSDSWRATINAETLQQTYTHLPSTQ